MTAQTLIQEYADMQEYAWTVNAATTGTAAEEIKRRKFVAQLNTAIRWSWIDHDPEWAFQWQLATGTPTVTNGKVPAASIVDSGTPLFCSLWNVDPRPEPPSQDIVMFNAVPDIDGGALITNGLPPQAASTCFAFYKLQCPIIPYSSTSDYSSTTMPDQLKFAILMYAMGIQSSSAIQNDEKNNFTQIATDWMLKRKEAIGYEGVFWMRNPCAL